MSHFFVVFASATKRKQRYNYTSIIVSIYQRELRAFNSSYPSIMIIA
nr:MAG TPA: hypothetical protein [Caudoviricetes sp.]